MTHPAPSSKPLRVRGGALAWGVVVGLAMVGLGQYVLDGGLGANTRINAPAPKQRISSPLYTVNTTTGTMQYNRANAFRDPTYNIYQRYTLDRTAYFSPTRSMGTTGARPSSSLALAAPTYRPTGPRSSMSTSSYAGVQRSASLRAPTYRAPTTRAASTRVR